MPKRRKYTTEQKVAILRRHLVDKVPVSQLCEEYKIQPSVLYQWQKAAFDNLGAALEAPGQEEAAARQREKRATAARIEYLESRLAKKDSVIAEISAEYVQLKKELGEP
jgi:transposase-like protein